MPVRSALHRRRRRGFTLVELVIAMSITSILFVAIVAWVASLMRMSATSVDLAAVARTRIAVTSLLADDLLATRPCDTATLDPVWDHATGASVGFYADVVDATGISGSDGFADLVVWRVADGLLERGIAVGDGTCPDQPTVTYATVATSVEQTADGAAYFTLRTASATQPPVADCADVAFTCRFDRLDLAIVAAQGDADDLPGQVRMSFVLDPSNQRA